MAVVVQDPEAEPMPQPQHASDAPVPNEDWLDADGEAYLVFTLDDEWPEHFGAARSGVP
jgi:hypothetical protein